MKMRHNLFGGETSDMSFYEWRTENSQLYWVENMLNVQHKTEKKTILVTGIVGVLLRSLRLLSQTHESDVVIDYIAEELTREGEK